MKQHWTFYMLYHDQQISQPPSADMLIRISHDRLHPSTYPDAIFNPKVPSSLLNAAPKKLRASQENQEPGDIEATYF